VIVSITKLVKFPAFEPPSPVLISARGAAAEHRIKPPRKTRSTSPVGAVFLLRGHNGETPV
jgi:hypothetical protein